MSHEAKKKSSLTLDDNLRAIKEIEDNPQDTRATVARLGYPVSTLKSIWIAREEIKKHADEAGPSSTKGSRAQDGRFLDLEEILFEWFQQ